MGVDGPPVMPEDPYAYVVAAFQDLPSPDYVLGSEETEHVPLSPELVLKPPLPVAVSPTADSPGYIAESDLEEDKEDPEEDPTNYPANGGDDDDDDDESSDDDEDDDDDVEEDEDEEEEEEEHPPPADSVPPPIHHVTSRMSIRDEPPTPFWSEAEVSRLLAIPSPPPSPLSPCSSPLPQIPSPPLRVSSPVPISPPPLPASPTYWLGYRVAMIRQRAESPSTSHLLPLLPPIILSHTRASVAMMRAVAPSTYILAPRSETLPSETPPSGIPPLLPIPLPIPSPPMLLPSIVCREGVSEVTLRPLKRLCIALGPRYEVGESSSAHTDRPTGGFRVDYGFVATLDGEIRCDLREMLVIGAPATDDTELGQQMTNFVTTFKQDTDEIYRRLNDPQDDRSLMSGQLNMLFRDRRAHARTTLLMKRERLDFPVRPGDDGDCSLTSSRLRLTGTACGDIETDETLQTQVTAPKWHQKSKTRANPATTTATTSVTNAQLKAMKDQGVIDALAARDADRNTNGNESHNSGTGVRRTEQVARGCTYLDFMKCQSLNFKGTEGVVELIQWFKKMETVFSISNCSVENQIKFYTCTLLAGALTWWNSHVRTVGHDVAYAMTWTDLKKKMTDKYCLRGEIKKLEAELWNLKVKGTDVIGYNQRFQELALLCVGMFPEESGKIERYVGDLPDMIHESVVASKPKTMQEAIEIATKLMAYTAGSGHFKRDYPKLKNNNRGNQGGNGNAPAKVYAVGRVGTNPDSNVITGTFLLNNRYASVLIETGADRSFGSTAFSSQINITPSTLDHYYDIELADGRIIGLNAIIQGCTLNFLNHPFNIDLVPVELGSLDIIIGMDWLADSV
ncbi:reverse transcriptase domain-containing protein [Tanacetum coccineum]